MVKIKALVLLIICLPNLVTSNSLTLNINNRSSTIFQEDKYSSEASGPSCLANSTSRNVPSCSLKLDDLPTGRFVAGSISRKGLLPKWINLTLARQGQKFVRDFKLNMAFGHVYGLISLLGIPDITDVLAFTEKSNTPDKAVMRYMATIAQVLIWYDNMLKEDEHENVVLTSLENVRVRHIISAQKAAAQMESKGTLINPGLCESGTLDDALWEDFGRDLEISSIPSRLRTFPASYSMEDEPLPISQFGQALTQFAFATIYPERLLIDDNDEDLFAFSHLWAIIGYALGIDDKYNIPLQPDIQHIKEYYQQIMDNYWLPSIFNLKNYDCSKYLVDSILKALEKILPIVTPRVLLMRLLTDILKIEVPNMKANMSKEDQLKEAAVEVLYLPLLQTPTSRAFANEVLTIYYVAVGTKYYGVNYTTEKSKAENVYYSL